MSFRAWWAKYICLAEISHLKMKETKYLLDVVKLAKGIKTFECVTTRFIDARPIAIMTNAECIPANFYHFKFENKNHKNCISHGKHFWVWKWPNAFDIRRFVWPSKINVLKSQQTWHLPNHDIKIIVSVLRLRYFKGKHFLVQVFWITCLHWTLKRIT